MRIASTTTVLLLCLDLCIWVRCLYGFVPAFRCGHQVASEKKGTFKFKPSLTSSTVARTTKERFSSGGVNTTANYFASVDRSEANFVTDGETRRKDESSYDWWNQWYPIHVVDTIDKSRPQKAYLLGMELVIWNSGGDHDECHWNVFEDACPHRQGPLSEGVIVTAPESRTVSGGKHEIMCSYHGWVFSGRTQKSDGANTENEVGGNCVSLPYSPPGDHEERHRHSCRASCRSFPTRVEHGLLFVFPQSGSDGRIKAALTPLPLVNDALKDDRKLSWRFKVPAGVRDFPCAWDTMVENTLDPAHFCAAHHGTLGNRYKDPMFYDQKLVWSGKGRLSESSGSDDAQEHHRHEGFQVAGDFGVLEYHPPCLVKYSPDNHAMPFGGTMMIATYCVPTRPGWVRPLASVMVKNGLKSWRNSTLAEKTLEVFMHPWSPAWLGHILSSVVLHQDSGLLYYQNRNFRAKGYPKVKKFSELAFTPNAADKAVVLFRQWLERKGGKDINWDPNYRDDPTEAIDIFDMWNAHTKNCQFCRAVYRRLEFLRKVCWVVFFANLVPASRLTSKLRWCVALSSSMVGLLLKEFNGLFLRYETNHLP